MAQVPASYIKNKAIDFDGEIFASIGLPIQIAGLAILPPSIGVFSLLETIDSLFVKDLEKSSAMDFYRALYITHHRKSAACEIREWLNGGGKKIFNPENKNSWQKWDYKIAEFAEKHDADLSEMVLLHRFLLENTFGGYDMIPSLGVHKSSYLFGADAIAGIFRIAGAAVGYDYEKIIWELPLCLVGHIAAIEAKANGMKGIARPKCPNDIKKQIKAAETREIRGELHPWQIKEPHLYGLDNAQVEANPEIKKEFNLCMKAYLKKQRKILAKKQAEAKENAA